MTGSEMNLKHLFYLVIFNLSFALPFEAQCNCDLSINEGDTVLFHGMGKFLLRERYIVNKTKDSIICCQYNYKGDLVNQVFFLPDKNYWITKYPNNTIKEKGEFKILNNRQEVIRRGKWMEYNDKGSLVIIRTYYKDGRIKKVKEIKD